MPLYFTIRVHLKITFWLATSSLHGNGHFFETRASQTFKPSLLDYHYEKAANVLYAVKLIVIWFTPPPPKNKIQIECHIQIGQWWTLGCQSEIKSRQHPLKGEIVYFVSYNLTIAKPFLIGHHPSMATVVSWQPDHPMHCNLHYPLVMQ